MSFTHLHLHTEYSLLDGMNRIDSLATYLKELGQDSCAITDHGNMYGSFDFYTKMRAAGIKPIIGCEVYVTHDHTTKNKDDNPLFHLILLAKNYVGYQNLCRIVSEAEINGFYYKPRADHKLLEQYSDGIICLTACIQGEVPKTALREGYDAALAVAKQYQDIFGKENFFIEVQNHGIPEELEVLPMLYKIADEIGAKTVATNDAHYMKKEDAETHDILLCVQTLSQVSDPNRMRFSGPYFYVKSEEEMLSLFPEHPESVFNTQLVADMCDVQLPSGTYHLPHFTDARVGEKYDQEGNKKLLRDLTFAGLKRFYSSEMMPQAIDRAEMELGVIEQCGFTDYFLIVQDFTTFARDHGISVGPGRGSAAGSIVAYAIGITEIEPLKYNLLFERFLNAARISMPDIDIDFEDRRRGEVIQYVRERYGEKSVAQVATFGRMEAKAAIKDVGRALGMSPSSTDKISKTIPFGTGLADALATVPDFKHMYDNGTEFDGVTCKRVIDAALKIESVIRNFGVHAAGVVIGDVELTNYLPLQTDKEGNVVAQWDKNMIEASGLLKMDFLGLSYLSVLSDAVTNVKQHEGIDVDLCNIPDGDPDAYKLLGTGDTIGIFQMESSGMRGVAMGIHPKGIEDLTAIISLYRPGTIKAGGIAKYLDRAKGVEKVEYYHPVLEKILKPTYGIIVYQEQVMQIAAQLAGYSLQEADLLRKAIGKKKLEIMQQQKASFIDRAEKLGVDRAIADKVFSDIEYFAGYGFNKSHAVAYATIGYRTAYMKAHHPVCYFAAIINSFMDDHDRLKELLWECKQKGIQVLPPDINRSEKMFTVEEQEGGTLAIRFGLLAIKNLGEKAIDDFLTERSQRPFSMYTDFVTRVKNLPKFNKKAVENIIKAGALDSFEEGDRAVILRRLEEDSKKKPTKRRKKASDDGEQLLPTEEKPQLAVPPIPLPSVASLEKEAFGFCIYTSPFDQYYPIIRRFGAKKPSDCDNIPSGASAIVLGTFGEVKKAKSKSGHMYAKTTIEDDQGQVEFMIFESSLPEFEPYLEQDGAVLAEVQIRREEDKCTMFARRLIGFYNPSDAALCASQEGGDDESLPFAVDTGTDASLEQQPQEVPPEEVAASEPLPSNEPLIAVDAADFASTASVILNIAANDESSFLSAIATIMKEHPGEQCMDVRFERTDGTVKQYSSASSHGISVSPYLIERLIGLVGKEAVQYIP